MRAKPHVYTDEQIDFLRENVKGRSRKELREMFNNHFNLKLNLSQITGTLKRNGLNSGRDARFKKGQKAWNKGMKGVNFGGENGKKTQFKKGNTPINHRPVGSERISVDGYIEIKVAEPNKWQLKHAVVWEQANGPIPKGHCVIFLDRNRLNVSLDNLQLITRNQLARLNQNHLIKDDPDLTKTGIVIADILVKIKERERGK